MHVLERCFPTAAGKFLFICFVHPGNADGIQTSGGKPNCKCEICISSLWSSPIERERSPRTKSAIVGKIAAVLPGLHKPLDLLLLPSASGFARKKITFWVRCFAYVSEYSERDESKDHRRLFANTLNLFVWKITFAQSRVVRCTNKTVSVASRRDYKNANVGCIGGCLSDQ